jgi:DNA-binding PadR family transcriptional regulator
MGRTATASDGFGREVILGLLAEEPSSCYRLDRRLADRFGSVGYTSGMAAKTVKRLAGAGLVRRVDSAAQAALGIAGSASVPVYEPTPAGIEHFREWMWASITTPLVREELHAKIALCRPGDLPRMIELVQAATLVCAGKLQDLNSETQRRRRLANPKRFSTQMDVVVSTGDQVWWECRIKWLQGVQMYLEGALQEYQTGSYPRVA